MRPEPGVRGKLTDRWMTLPGTAKTGRTQHIPRGRSYPTHLDSTTCWGTYGNGARTGSVHIPPDPRSTHKGRPRVNYGLRAGDASTATPFTNGQREEIATSRTILRRVSGSGL